MASNIEHPTEAELTPEVALDILVKIADRMQMTGPDHRLCALAAKKLRATIERAKMPREVALGAALKSEAEVREAMQKVVRSAEMADPYAPVV